MDRANRPQPRQRQTPPKKSQVPPERSGGGGKAFLKAFFMVLVTILLVGMTTAGICGVAAAVYINRYIIPEAYVDLSAFRNDRMKETSFIYYKDANGNEVELQKLHSTENRVWASINEIPEMLQMAFVSVEDETFFTHQGVSWRRTIGAGLNFVVGIEDFTGGGSTITQQLIKNVTGDDETSVHRKILEIFRALELEKDYSKDEILELYLNTIYFGQGAYGVRQAAKTYFDKELHQLTLAECAAIAGTVKNPYKYDLLRFPEHNQERRETVLWTMLDNEIISRAEYDRAKAEKVAGVRNISADDTESQTEYQSYYVDAVIEAVIDDLKDQYGYSQQFATTLLYTGGLKIVIPINMELQEKMDAVFKDVENFPGDLGSTGTYPQAAMVLIEPSTGYVLALYGGRGEKYGDRLWNRATLTHRQPGSAIKPLTVYTPAFEMLDGFLPISVMDDAPKDFEVNPAGWPKNENRKYSGRTTIFRGVGSSLNTIAVGVMQQVTPEKAFTYARNSFKFSEKSLVRDQTITYKDGTTAKLTDMAISPLALGGLTNGVTVLEMTAAYATFVNEGYYNEPILYTAVYQKDASGNYDMQNPMLKNDVNTTSERVMTTRTRDYILDLMTYVTQYGTGTKARIDGVEVAGKTGTTSDDNDRWFAGMTPDFAAVVWFGYDMPQSLQKFSTNPSLELWHRVMSSIYADLDEGAYTPQFGRLNTYKSVTYCADSGMMAGDACKADYRGESRAVGAKIQESDYAGFVARGVCTLHQMVEIDVGTGGIAGDFCPSGVDAAGNSLRKQVGVLVLEGENRRVYPAGGIAITDHEWVLDFGLTELEAAQGLHKPTTSSRITGCTVHNVFNDGNVVEGHPDDSYVEYDPDDPSTWPEEEDPWWTDPQATEPDGGETTDPPVTNPPIIEPTAHPETEPDTTGADPPTNFD